MAHQQNLCYNCSKDFESLSKHWSLSTNCDYPEISSEQIEILTGVLMGDGCVDRHSSENWAIVCNNINKEYLEYISNEMLEFSRGIRIDKTPEKSAKSSGFGVETNPENYNTIYKWTSMSHPQINNVFNWYDNDKKEFPCDINLTPTVLKNWYCCDGHYEAAAERIRISISNEHQNKGKIESYFKRNNLPIPSGYNENLRRDGSTRCGAYWTEKDSKILFRYMGNPLPGFEYKWPERFK